MFICYIFNKMEKTGIWLYSVAQRDLKHTLRSDSDETHFDRGALRKQTLKC